MGKGEDFNLLKIQTHILKVNIHCDGCKFKVKKLLRRTEGVFSVSIDVEQQKVTVSGTVDSEALIRKLIRAGKRSELWSQKINQNQKPIQQKQQQKQVANLMKDDNKNNKEQDKQGLMRGLKAFKNQHNKFFSSSSDEDYYDDDDDVDDEDDLRFVDTKMKQINLMRQANNAAANAKKAGNGNGSVSAAANGGCKRKGGGNANQGRMKGLNVSHQKGTDAAANNKMASGNSPNAGDGKRVEGNNGMVGLVGPNVLGGSNGGLAGNGFNGFTGRPTHGGGGQYQPPVMVNMQEYQAKYPSSMVNNLRGHNMGMHDSRYMQQPQMMHFKQQPQMMHFRSPQISPYTGYYNCYPSPYYVSSQVDNGYYGTHLFSDENTNACTVM